MPDNIAFEPDEGRAVAQGEGGEGGSGGSSGEQLYIYISTSICYIGHIIHCLRLYRGCRTIRRHAILGQSFLNDPLIDTECL